MIKRISTGWTFIRVLYCLMGSFVVVSSIMEKQWMGVLFGGYFIAMGLFAFGCAAGNCFNTNSMDEGKKIHSSREINFEEIKEK